MRKNLLQVIIVVLILVATIKFIPQVNDWARGNLPETVLTVIGEKPKGIFERGSDTITDGLKKGSEMVEDLVDKVKN